MGAVYVSAREFSEVRETSTQTLLPSKSVLLAAIINWNISDLEKNGMTSSHLTCFAQFVRNLTLTLAFNHPVLVAGKHHNLMPLLWFLGLSFVYNRFEGFKHWWVIQMRFSSKLNEVPHLLCAEEILTFQDLTCWDRQWSRVVSALML